MLAVAAGMCLFATGAGAQSFSVSDPTRLDSTTYYWTPLTIAGSGGAFLTDPQLDQQTGQIEDDLIGSTVDPGFLMRFGQIEGQDAVAFRLIENKPMLSRGVPTFSGQVSVGMDADGTGSLDIVFTAIGKNQGKGINYQAPGTGTNDSPSTTTLGSPVLITTFTSLNFDYRLVDATIYPGYTQTGTDPDAVLTFAITLAQVNAALAAVNQPAIGPSTLVRFIAFTSTQTNAINQDIYGSAGISGAVRFDAPGGGFTEFTDLTGQPVPEPSTMVGVAALMGVGLWVRWRRERRSKSGSAGRSAVLPV